MYRVSTLAHSSILVMKVPASLFFCALSRLVILLSLHMPPPPQKKRYKKGCNKHVISLNYLAEDCSFSSCLYKFVFWKIADSHAYLVYHHQPCWFLTNFEISLTLVFNIFMAIYRRSYGEMAHTHILVEFSILRFSIISIVHIPFHIFWNSQFLIRCNFCVIITFVESCHFICPNN